MPMLSLVHAGLDIWADQNLNKLQSPASGQLIKGVSLALLAGFLGACGSAIVKHLSGSVNTETIVLFQFAVCFACLLPWLLRHGPSVLKTQKLGMHIIRGVSGCLAFYAMFLSLKHIPLVDAALLRNTAPLFVPLVLFAWVKIRIPKLRWLPLFIGFIGVLVVLRPSQQAISGWHIIGLLSGLGLAVSMVSTRFLSKDEPESRILFYYFLISLLFVIPLYAFNYQPVAISSLPWLIGLGLIMYFGLMLYTRSFQYGKASVLAPTSYFGIVFAGLLDWVIWHQLPDIWSIIGIVLISLGGVIMLTLGND